MSLAPLNPIQILPARDDGRFIRRKEADDRFGDKLDDRRDDNAEARRKPYLLVARLLGMVKERQNKTTGLMEWVFSYISGGLPKVVVLKGKGWTDIIEGDHPADVQAAIEKEVAKRIDADYKHIDKKTELRSAYEQLVLARFTDSGEDDQDAEFLALAAMQKPLLEIVGLPAQDD